MAYICHLSRQGGRDREPAGTEHACGFSPTQASIASCRQKNNVCARAGFLSKTPRGFIPSSASGGPAPGKQPLVFEFLLWLRCSWRLCRRTLVVGVETVEAEKVLNPERIRDRWLCACPLSGHLGISGLGLLRPVTTALGSQVERWPQQATNSEGERR